MSEFELPDWIADHLKRYTESNGEDGHMWNGVPCLLLTTKGKSSGEARTLPLIYGLAGDDPVIVASKGGAPNNPLWYENLAANPEVAVQVGAEKFAANARTTTGEQRTELWSRMLEIWPSYAEYQEKTEREIPVVILERT
ncbi:MAG: nitroreductase family deazaflavin-dependent oxidoreductase [Acidobacteriota bacterium]|nr:nitroreductase family deazaflavin-dependent oxidoreductase [Acidobacteriota bacterium]